MGFFNKLWNWMKGKEFEDSQNEYGEIRQRDDYDEIENRQYSNENDIKEQQEEKQLRLLKEEPEEEPEEINDVKQEIKKVEERIKRNPTVKSVVERINQEGVNNIKNIKFDGNLGELKPIYQKIFTENAKLNDSDILDVLIENRDKLQHRFVIRIEVYSREGIAGTLVVNGILIEHAQEINDILRIGMEIDYLREIFEQYLDYYKNNYGAISGDFEININKKFTISDIRIDASFA